MEEVENVSDDEVDVRRMNTQSYVTSDDLDEKLLKLELEFVQEQEKRMDRIEKLFGARAENKDKCYNCQGYGHFAKNCPKRTRSPSPRSSQNTSPARRDINITRVPNQGRAIRIPLKVNGINTFAVIDTGADATVVSDEVAEKARIVPDEPKSVRLSNATNDSEMNAFGEVTATIQMANHPYEWKVFVAQSGILFYWALTS